MLFWVAKRILAVILLACFALFTSCQRAVDANELFRSLNVNSWLQAYEAIDLQINGGQGYATHLDTIGYLSWRQSRILDSYLNVYEATKDAKWIEKFIHQADLVLSHRDDRSWGRDTPTWSNLKYLNTGWRRPEPLLVNNAMIVYPLARFAALVLQQEGGCPSRRRFSWRPFS